MQLARQASISTDVAKTEFRIKMHSLTSQPKKSSKRMQSPGLSISLLWCEQLILKLHFCLRQSSNHQLLCSQLLHVRWENHLAGQQEACPPRRTGAETLLENPVLLHQNWSQHPAHCLWAECAVLEAGFKPSLCFSSLLAFEQLLKQLSKVQKWQNEFT